MDYPLAVEILITAKVKDEHRSICVTLLSTRKHYAADVKKMAKAADKFCKSNRRWPLKNPKYMGIMDVHWANSAKPRGGTAFSTFTYQVSGQEEALQSIKELETHFPLWVISPYVLLESYFYLPPHRPIKRPKLRAVQSIVSRFSLKRGFPLASKIERQLTSRRFLESVALPRRYPPGVAPVLLDWTLIPVEAPQMPFPPGAITIDPWVYYSHKDLRKEILTKRQVEKRVREVVDRQGL